MLELVALVPALCLPGVVLALVRERRLARARAELVVRACHEVRGPLAAAHLALHALARGGVATGAVEDQLWRAARALADLAAAPSGALAADAPEPVDAGALVLRQTASWRAAVEARGGELRLRGRVPQALVHADRLRLAQAMANLVGNALEHGGGRIEVAVTAGQDLVAITVTDEGPGLGEPLARIVGRARDGSDSRGRGLAITAEIAARHGGRLATAPSARGARLVLELPAWQAAEHGQELPAR